MPDYPCRFTKVETSTWVGRANRRAEPPLSPQRINCRSGGLSDMGRDRRFHRGHGSLSPPFPSEDPWRLSATSWPSKECPTPEDRTSVPRCQLRVRAEVSDRCLVRADTIGWTIRACDSSHKRSQLAPNARWPDGPGSTEFSHSQDPRARSYNYIHVVCQILNGSWPRRMELSPRPAVRERSHSRVCDER